MIDKKIIPVYDLQLQTIYIFISDDNIIEISTIRFYTFLLTEVVEMLEVLLSEGPGGVSILRRVAKHCRIAGLINLFD